METNTRLEKRLAQALLGTSILVCSHRKKKNFIDTTFVGTNIITEEEVAIKLESVKAKHPQLEYEAKVYKAIAGGVGVPFVRWFGSECDYVAMVIDLLGRKLSFVSYTILYIVYVYSYLKQLHLRISLTFVIENSL